MTIDANSLAAEPRPQDPPKSFVLVCGAMRKRVVCASSQEEPVELAQPIDGLSRLTRELEALQLQLQTARQCFQQLNRVVGVNIDKASEDFFERSIEFATSYLAAHAATVHEQAEQLEKLANLVDTPRVSQDVQTENDNGQLVDLDLVSELPEPGLILQSSVCERYVSEAVASPNLAFSPPRTPEQPDPNNLTTLFEASLPIEDTESAPIEPAQAPANAKPSGFWKRLFRSFVRKVACGSPWRDRS